MDLLPQEPKLVARLASHRLFDSQDLDETRSTVGRVFKPHELGVCGPRQKLDAQMGHMAVGRVSINRLRYGADVTIEPECLDDFLLVQMPLRGRAQIKCGTQSIISTPFKASVITPSQPLHMRWQGQCDQLIVRIERQSLEDACSTQLGYALPKPLEFKLGMALRDSYGQAWKNLVEFLASSAFISGAATNELVTSHIEQLLVTTLLGNHPHNYSDALSRPQQKPARRYVLQAEEYIRANCAQPITLQTLTRHTNVSARSLHQGFQEYLGIGPMAFLKLVRLQHIRDHLLEARQTGQSVSITKLALDWGFGHLGRFTQDYRKRYNETPSQTLRG